MNGVDGGQKGIVVGRSDFLGNGKRKSYGVLEMF